MLTQCCALELTPKYGIKANTVSPSMTLTPFAKKSYTEDEIKETAIKNPSKRLGEVEDTVNAVLFLLSDKADYINGENLNVNGGINKQLTDVNKALLVYYYAANHAMLKTIDASTYNVCAAGNGVCQAITTDDYAEIAKKYGVPQEPTTVFDAAHIYEDQYLYTGVVNDVDATYSHSNIEAYRVGDDIALVETLTIKSGAGAELEQTVTYLFKSDADDHYSLYSIARA